MKKKALKAALAFFICWVFFVALEGLLLIGSTDPGKAPLIVLGGAHIADEIDAYSSLGFSQTYYLTYPDSFVSGLIADILLEEIRTAVDFLSARFENAVRQRNDRILVEINNVFQLLGELF